MKLSDSAKQYLSKEIKFYYDDESKLKNIFTMNAEIFGTNFYGNIQGIDLNTKIDSLVLELIKTTKLKSFITLVREDYSNFAKELDKKQLISILNNDFEANKTIYIEAYRASKSRRNIIGEKNLENIENLIDNLNTSQDYYYNYIKFVVYLIENSDFNKNNDFSKNNVENFQKLQKELKEWLDINVNEDIISRLCEEIRTEKREQEQEKPKPCILVKIISEGQGYVVYAWLIENIEKYGQASNLACQPLKFRDAIQISTDANLTNLPEIIKDFIQQTFQKYATLEQIHIFLPHEMMNHAVDYWNDWQEEDDNVSTIGENYQVIIRFSKRFDINNTLSFEKWKSKSSIFMRGLKEPANKFFISSDEKADYNTFDKRLKNDDTVRGVYFTNVLHDKKYHQTLFQGGIPLALWIRPNSLNFTETDINKLFSKLFQKDNNENILLQELPYQVKRERGKGNNISKHLCLLWDDPNLLPPKQNLTDTKI
ncbi:hypothetical protein MEO94_24500 [Dolichospermum sp. ST_sed9]|nr:hypothetical protein [Dolichospermum sp. ST_sed9]